MTAIIRYHVSGEECAFPSCMTFILNSPLLSTLWFLGFPLYSLCSSRMQFMSSRVALSTCYLGKIWCIVHACSSWQNWFNKFYICQGTWTHITHLYKHYSNQTALFIWVASLWVTWLVEIIIPLFKDIVYWHYIQLFNGIIVWYIQLFKDILV